MAYWIGKTHLFSCIPWVYTCVLMPVLSLYCNNYQLFLLVYAYKSLAVFAFLNHILQNTAKGKEKKKKRIFNLIQYHNIYVSEFVVCRLSHCYWTKQSFTHTSPCPSSPVITRSFKARFSCAGFYSVFTLVLNWTADIPQTVANTAQSVALRDKNNMYVCNICHHFVSWSDIEGERVFIAETTCTNCKNTD